MSRNSAIENAGGRRRSLQPTDAPANQAETTSERLGSQEGNTCSSSDEADLDHQQAQTHITALILLALLAGEGGEACDQCHGQWMNLYGGGPCTACNRGRKR